MTGVLLFSMPNPSPATDDQFGNAVAVRGDLIAIGSILDDPGGFVDAGAVYVFDVTGSPVVTVPNPVPGSTSFFG